MDETTAAASLVMSVALRWRAAGRGEEDARGEVEDREREAGSLQVATWGARDVGCCKSRGRTRHLVHSVYLATRQAPPGGPTSPRRERCVVLLFLAQVMEDVEAKSKAGQRPPALPR